MTEPDLLEEFDTLQEQRGPRCRMNAILLDLAASSPEQARKASVALATERVEGTTIAKWLRSHGYRVEAQTVNRHRRGDCACGR